MLGGGQGFRKKGRKELMGIDKMWGLGACSSVDMQFISPITGGCSNGRGLVRERPYPNSRLGATYRARERVVALEEQWLRVKTLQGCTTFWHLWATLEEEALS